MSSELLGVTVKPTGLTPAISPNVHFSLTVGFIILYGFLFLMVYVQLWMILYYKHKRLSYQTVFLFLCLLWAGLRTTLFSFYFKNCVLANNLPAFFYWLLYCFPVVLQFVTLCLLVAFFAQVVLRPRPREERLRLRQPIWASCAISIVVFLSTNVTCALIVSAHQYDSSPLVIHISLVRVVINDSLFIFAAVALSVCIIKMTKTAATSVVLEAQGTTKFQAIIASVLIILLYTSRALYNIVAVAQPFNDILSFGYGWINVSDQADYLGLDEQSFAYVSFGIVLFIWEFLPTFIVILLFRVQQPRNMPALPSITISSAGPFSDRSYVFDNPRRYDSDDDIARRGLSHGVGSPGINGPPTSCSFSPGAHSFSAPVYDAAVPILYDPVMRPLPPQNTDANEPQFYDGT